MRAVSAFKAVASISFALPFLIGCSGLKPLESRYNVRSDEQGFIYGRLGLDNRDYDRIELTFGNEAGKQKVLTHDYREHLYDRREADFAVRIPPGNWHLIMAKVEGTGKEPLMVQKPIRFDVTPAKGNYLGTWWVKGKDMVVKDEKKMQDGRLADSYSQISLTETVSALPR